MWITIVIYHCEGSYYVAHNKTTPRGRRREQKLVQLYYITSCACNFVRMDDETYKFLTAKLILFFIVYTFPG